MTDLNARESGIAGQWVFEAVSLSKPATMLVAIDR
jgi:hypothetical protein